MSKRSKDTLIVMTRLPREGRTKTRLIPALGAAGAAAMHDRLARHTTGRASSYTMRRPGTSLRILVEGGSPAEAREWLNGGGTCRRQESGHLGIRLEIAVDDAFTEGARRVVVIGTDCPQLDEATLGEAFDALDNADLVFGPALDGGYFLIGFSTPFPAVFANIDWGGPTVLAQSLEAAKAAGKRVYLLPPLPDVDLPEDLPAAYAALAAGEAVSVIVPSLNEENHISLLLDQLVTAKPHEILLADGGSTDRTMELANRPGVKRLNAPRGRAAQMNYAASVATGEFLLFLHADTLPPPRFPEIVACTLQTPDTSAGAFRFQTNPDLPAAALIESLVYLRCNLRHIPYGDQGLFLRRSLFHSLGGFPEWPVMEDYHMVRRLGRIGNIRVTQEPAITSSRRWSEDGVIRTFLRHQLMLAAYHLGVPPARIARLRP